MKSKYQRELRRKYKYALFVVIFSLFTILSGVYPLIDWKVKERPNPIWYDPNLADYLYEDDIDQTSYSFNAMNESYIMCEIQNTDYTTFTFNSSVYNVSYGLNIFPIDFGNQNQSYNIEISQDDANNDVFDWLCVQPLFIKEDIIDVNLITTTDISFYAGGPISILVQPNFSYNWLYLEIDGKIINDIYDTSTYSELTPDLLITTKFDGAYIQYNLDMIPNSHQMKLKGNGSINYKIICASDWDDDFISDIEEIQKMKLDFRFDPIKPNVWGYFEQGDRFTNTLNYIDEIAMFRFFIPDSYSGEKHFSLSLKSGIFSEIELDGEDLHFKDRTFHTSWDKANINSYLGKLESGFHILTYKFKDYVFMDISFYLDGREILILDKWELRDSDGDGVKNVKESMFGSDPLNPDSDFDGLIDAFDESPIYSLSFKNNEICRITLSHNSSRNTMIDIDIKRPENDYYTNETKIWKAGGEGAGMEVNIVPILRLFGNSTISLNDLKETWQKDIVSYILTDDSSSNGDGVPDLEDEDAELCFISPQVSENSFKYSFYYKIGHSAKIDNIIDLRFDVVWTVFAVGSNYSEIIHFYDFDDDIVIQSIAMREFQNISYILASPDSMIENQILWNLVQNDNLGSFTDFSVNDDIVGNGNIDYYEFQEQLEEDRQNNPISNDTNGDINETEVLYFAMEYSNIDVLSKIKTKVEWLNPPTYLDYEGNYDIFFSFFSRSDISEEELISFIPEENLGEHRICYSKSYDNYSQESSGSFEKRVSISEFPIYMNRIDDYEDAEILETSSSMGSSIPLDEFPYTRDDVSYDRITLINATIIEADSSEAIPKISFDDNTDEYKDNYDDGGEDVQLSEIVFTQQGPGGFTWVQEVLRLRDKFTNHWLRFHLTHDYPPIAPFFRYLYADPPADVKHMWTLRQLINGPINIPLYGDTTLKIWNELATEGVVDGIYRTICDVGMEADLRGNALVVELFSVDDNDPFGFKWGKFWGETFGDFNDYYSRIRNIKTLQSLIRRFGDLSALKNMWKELKQMLDDTPIDSPYYQARLREFNWINDIVPDGAVPQNWKPDCQVILRQLNQHQYDLDKVHMSRIRAFFRKESVQRGIKNLAPGIFSGAIGIICLYTGIWDIINTINSNKDNPLLFGCRIARAIVKTTMGFTLVIASILYIRQAIWEFKVVFGKSVENAIKWCGRIVFILGAVLCAVEYILNLIKLQDLTGPEFWASFTILTLEFLFLSVIPLIISIYNPLIGAGVWVLMFIVWSLIVGWDSPPNNKIYEPSMEIVEGESNTYYTFPEADLKRHGGLEVGDTIKLTMKVHNDGNTMSYLQANFSAGGSSYTCYKGKWDNDKGYAVDEYDTLNFTRTLTTPETYLELKIGLQIDSEIGGDREEIYRGVEETYGSHPILDASISEFYDDLTDWDKPNAYDSLIDEYNSLKDTYKHKDVKDTLNILKQRVDYDFLEDTVGSVPSGWNKAKKGYGVFPVIIRANEDIETQWSDPYSTAHFVEIDEHQDNPDGDYIKATFTADNYDYETFGFEDFCDTQVTIPEVKVNIRAKYDGTPAPYDDMNVWITYNGGTTWESQKSITLTSSYTWHTLTWNCIHSDLDDFQVKIQCPYLWEWTYVYVDTIYANLTYTKTDNTVQQLVAEKDGHSNTMVIEIFGQEVSCDFYRNLGSSYTSGLIEFWLFKESYSNVLVDSFFIIDDYGVFYDVDNNPIYARPIHSHTWEQFKVEYNSTHFDLYHNGIKIGDDIAHDKTNFAKVNFTVYNNHFYYDYEEKYHIGRLYLDAIDFSWSSGYYNGRNFRWNYTLDQIQEYTWEYGNCTFGTNIATDLSENVVEMDTTTDIAEFDFYLDLEGTDNSTVNYTFDIPDGFSITPTSIEQSLQSKVAFNISANDPFQLAGIYYFDMNITINNIVIYSEHIPFIIPVVESLTISQSNIIFEETDINGDYTATYDFLDDTVDTTPDGWTTSGYDPLINSGVDDHNKIVELNDTGSSYSQMYNSVSDITNGTIDFWVRKSNESVSGNSNTPLAIYLQDYGNEFAFQIYIDINNSGKITRYYEGDVDDVICDNFKFEHDTWYHISIEFNCKTDLYSIYINGFLEAGDITFWNFYELDINLVDRIYFSTFGGGDYNGIWYVDAIGYSWDSNYLIGDNKHKTAIDSDTYESSEQLEKGDAILVEFKTNSMSEIVMKLLDNNVVEKTYSIVPRGNNYFGIQVRQIIVDGSFSFDEIEFSQHEYNYIEVYKISIIDAGLSVSQQFNPLNFSNNGNVPKFISFSFSGIPFDSINQTGHEEEFYNETQIITILPNSNRVYECDIIPPNESISNLFWRGILYHESGANKLYNHYIDNLDFDGIYISSPKNMTHNIIGDTVLCEQNEINLDIIPEENLVWSAYSLDGNVNITFSGSVNITLPDTDGLHSIQVFGNNSGGTMFESEIRNFTIYHPIQINSPENCGKDIDRANLLNEIYSFDNDSLSPDWYDAEWKYRKKIRIDHDYFETFQNDYQFYLRIDSIDDLRWHSQWDGDDILFTKDDGTTKLSHEIVTYSSGSLKCYVKVPSISDGVDTYLYMYYGNPECPNQEDVAGTWSNNFDMVHHFEETSGNALDSTSNNVDLTPYNSIDQSNTGFVGNCYYWDGNNDFLKNTNYALPNTEYTAIAMIKPLTMTSYKHIWSKGDSGESQSTNVNCIKIKATTDDFLLYTTETGGGTNHDFEWDVDENLDDGNWHFVGVHIRSGLLYMYSDSSLYITYDFVNSDSTSTIFRVGAYRDSDGGYFYGYIDELIIADNNKGKLWVDSMRECWNNWSTARYIYSEEVQGENPPDWTIVEPDELYGYVEIDEWRDGQHNSVEIRNKGYDYEVYIQKNFENAYQNGKVSLRIFRESIYYKDTVILTLLGTGGQVYLTLEYGNMYYGQYQTKQLFAENVFKNYTWHDIEIIFDVSVGVHVFIDNETYCSMYNIPFSVGSPNFITGIKIESKYIASRNYGFWIDDVFAYQYKEGLLLDIFNPFGLSDIEYSLDGQSRTSFDNPDVITYQPGEHSIIFYGNDTYGDEYQSENCTFTVNIAIVSPYNETYFEAMDGYYPATYGFENDTIGEIPSEWDMHYNVSGDSLEVIESYNDHNYVVDIDGISIGTSGSNTNYEAPAQWDDFTFTYGTGASKGDLVQEGSGYASINPGSYYTWGSESYLGYIKPNSDITTNWNNGDGTPHATRLDEAKGDMNGDGGNIRETTVGVDDRWDFTTLTLPSGHRVTKLVYYGYVKKQTSTCTAYISIDSSFSIYGSWTPDGTSYGWKSYTLSGLDKSQNDLNNFWMNVEPQNIPPYFPGYEAGWVDIETVYVEVYTKQRTTNYKQDWSMTWDVTDADLRSIDYFTYKYCTSISIDCDLDIYNWDTPGWEELESNSAMYTWISDSFSLNDSYISGSNQVKVRVQTASSTSSFQIGLDVIRLQYDNVQIDFDARSLAMVDEFSLLSSGTIEFWSYFTGDFGNNRIIFNNDITIYHDADGKFYWYNGTKNEITSWSINTWVHFKISWINNDVDIYINGTKYLDTYWSNGATSLANISFSSYGGYNLYVDAVGYSWDNNYNIGDNTEEGILLEIILEDIEYDWIKYSLDGQNNITIYGNCVISYPTLGTHTIQLFAKASSGETHISEIRYFTIE